MEILIPVAARLLEDFFVDAPGRDTFVLAGGTALALADFQHRRSDDLDFFSRQPGAVERFARAIRTWGIERGFEVSIDPEFDTRYQTRYRFGLGEEVVKIDLCVDSPPFLGEPRERGGIRYDARRNLFASKLGAFFGRGEPKDAVDAYFIFSASGEDPAGLVSDALEKEVGRDLDSIARGLELFEPLDLPDSFLESYMIKPVSKAGMKARFREVAAALRMA
jgi:predicted nucleotidyltransferase component of viral defense system